MHGYRHAVVDQRPVHRRQERDAGPPGRGELVRRQRGHRGPGRARPHRPRHAGRAHRRAGVQQRPAAVILHVDPQVLIICEGLGFAADLTGVHTHPIKLNQPNKVVYSMHDYHWFHTDANQKPAAYAAAMNQKGGFLLTGNIAPLWIGEFGRICADSATEGAKPWWGNITAWLAQEDVDWCWWALNPVHGQASPPPGGSLSHAGGTTESFGLLTQDWSGLGFPGIVTSLKQIMHPQSGPHVVAHHP